MSELSGNLTVEELGSRSAVAGSLSELTALELLQAIHDSRRSAELSIRSAQQLATLFFRDGDIIDAELASLRGEPAVYQALSWIDGSFEVEFREIAREDSMRTSTRRMLWEGRRRLDERRRRIAQLPDLGAVFDVDCERLLERLTELPDEINLVLKHFDAELPLREILSRSELDELTTLAAFARLITDRVIYDVSKPAPSTPSISPIAHEAYRVAPAITTLPPPRLGLRSTLDYEMNAGEAGSRPAPTLLQAPVADKLPGWRTLRGIHAPAVPEASSLVPPAPTSNRPTVRAGPLDENLGSGLRTDPGMRRLRRRKRSMLEGQPARRVRKFGAAPRAHGDWSVQPSNAAPDTAAVVPPESTISAQTASTRMIRATGQTGVAAQSQAARTSAGHAPVAAPRSRGMRTAIALALVLGLIVAMLLIAHRLATR